MDQLSTFMQTIKNIVGSKIPLSIDGARMVVKELNEFLYTNYQGIGETEALGQSYEYISDFHKYWEQNHKEILDCQIDEKKCELVATALHETFVKTKGKVFTSLYDTCGLSKEDVCRVRFLTANQDFRGSRDFTELAEHFNDDPSLFDEDSIVDDPDNFIKEISATSLSQNDKRVTYAKNIAQFLLDKKCSPYELVSKYDSDVYKLREDLINSVGSGYGNKKADMFIRDMVVLDIWNNVKGFDKIDVASDINTIKVALRTGIIKTAIPLVSSFLDIFCHQYAYIDEMNAKAWRKVWQIWQEKYPTQCISSPCLIDYFVYRIVGKEMCKENMYIFECETQEHIFKWHSGRNKTCQTCAKAGKKNIKAKVIRRIMACTDNESHIVMRKIKAQDFLTGEEKLGNCPFVDICEGNRYKEPPKSISILGQTGWATAYSRKNNGGGGLMA